jgi:glycerophosphoryl diester phosphodiesterase
LLRLALARRFPDGKGAFEIVTLEEELEFIQALNQSAGRNVGIYPEIKKPGWHREQGRDISHIVVTLLEKYGYETKGDACFLQYFEIAEVDRIRNELGWDGRIVMLTQRLLYAGLISQRLRGAAMRRGAFAMELRGEGIARDCSEKQYP